MCGICGVIQLGGAPGPPVDASNLDRMTDVMIHRGPNDRGVYLAPGIALGVRRLSVVDVVGGHQPFGNEDGHIHAIQNGEIYNHLDLRRELVRDGHRFASRCDTEVLPHLYERFGADFVPHLRGMFGLAVWDGRQRRAVLARDRLGIKPLYYADAGTALVFGSELKSVLASGLVSTELDLEAIDSYLSLGFVPAPRTPLADVRKLMPGEQLVVDDGRVRLERYWEFPPPAPEPLALRSEDDWAEELLAILDESVRMRLMADVPLGAMLSGGLDSSLIVALMASRMTSPVKTFSVGFIEAQAENELPVAREVASLFGTEHHEIELSFATQDVDLAELTWFMDEPVADLSALGFLALSKLAAESVTVALTGQGADELLGGYSRHRNARIASYLMNLPHPIARVVRAAGAFAPNRLGGVASVVRASDHGARQLAAFGELRHGLKPALRAGPLGRLDGSTALSDVYRRLGSTSTHDPLAGMLFLDGQLGLVDDMLHYFDRTSMAYSLEVRVPFLDHELVEFCARVPTGLKVHRTTTKYLLKQAARSLLPSRVIDRKKVGFFNAAVDSWFRGQSHGAIPRYLLADNPAYGAFANPTEVQKIVRRHAAGKMAGRSLLPLLMLEIWLTEFLPRASAAPRTPVGAAA